MKGIGEMKDMDMGEMMKKLERQEKFDSYHTRGLAAIKNL